MAVTARLSITLKVDQTGKDPFPKFHGVGIFPGTNPRIHSSELIQLDLFEVHAGTFAAATSLIVTTIMTDDSYVWLRPWFDQTPEGRARRKEMHKERDRMHGYLT